MSEPTCLFCKIVRREIPATLLFENDLVLAFNDVSPQAPRHVLVIPKRHVASLDELTDAQSDLAAALLLGAQRVAREQGLSEGYRTVINTGGNAGQSVAHIHAHVLGGRRLTWPPG